ncbi:hypothetical protein D3C74_202410 [compost metagenome]
MFIQRAVFAVNMHDFVPELLESLQLIFPAVNKIPCIEGAAQLRNLLHEPKQLIRGRKRRTDIIEILHRNDHILPLGVITHFPQYPNHTVKSIFPFRRPF